MKSLNMNNKSEISLIKLSAIGAFAFGLLGTVWGITVKSNAVIFDGIYSFLITLLALGSIYVSKRIHQGVDDTFQFGKFQFETLFLIIRSFILIALCGYSIIAGIFDLFGEGLLWDPHKVTIYALISVVGGLLMLRHFNRANKKLQSNLVSIESLQWKIDTYLSLGVLISSLLTIAFHHWNLDLISPYIDPVVVIILAIIVVIVPLRTLQQNIKDLMFVAPKDDREVKFNKIADYIVKFYGFSGKNVRVARSGRMYFVDVNILVDEDWKFTSIKELDLIREQFEKQIIDQSSDTRATVSFTAKEKWL